MKLKLYIFSIIFILFCSLELSAQQNIDSEVRVDRQFETVLKLSTKSPLNISYPDSLSKLNLNFNYSLFDSPYEDLYEFTPMRSDASFNQLKSVLYPVLYAKLKVATASFDNVMPYGSIYVRPRIGDKTSLVFFYNHDSMWGDAYNATMNYDNNTISKSIYKTMADNMVNDMGFRLKYSWEEGEIDGGLKYTNSFNTFYGSGAFEAPDHNALRDIASHTVNNLLLDARIKSTDIIDNSFFYDVAISYENTSESRLDYLPPIGSPYNNNPILEQSINLNSTFGFSFLSEHYVFLQVKNNNIFWKDKANAAFGILELSPTYLYLKDRFDMRLGLTFAFPYSKKAKYLYPNISIRYKAVPDYLWLDFKLDGENVLNTYSSLYKQNPWLIQDIELKNTTIPLRLKLALNGGVKSLFSYSLAASLSYNEDFAMFAYDFTNDNLTMPIYNNFWAFTAESNVGLKFDLLSVSAYFKYNSYFTAQTSMLPKTEIGGRLKYTFRERFFLDFNIYHRGATDAIFREADMLTIWEVPSFWDLDLTLSYALNTETLLFIEAKNILNQTIIYIPNYLRPGLTFGAGICFKF